MRLILARHGETAGNKDNLAIGRLDVPLNETGQLQAQALSRFLARVPLAAVYSSPLQRAQATARAVAVPHDLPVLLDDRLTEMDVGEMDGHSIQEMLEVHADFLKRWFGPEAGELCMPGGECLRDVQERAWKALESIHADHPDEVVCAVSHNFTIHVLLCRALGLPISEFRRLRHDLAAVSVLDVKGDRATLVRLNDTCHLEQAGVSERPLY